jgi:hypothetical protein
VRTSSERVEGIVAEVDLDERWLPPSPHREAIVAFIRKGRAHVEDRGHGIPPMVLFEDGGAMELPLIRMTPDGKSFFAVQGEAAARQTKHPDVCGTVDEFKKAVAAGTSDGASLLGLVKDACHMIGRMQRRREQYQGYAAAVAAVTEKLKAIQGPDAQEAFAKAEALRSVLQGSPGEIAQRREEIISLAEGIRRVAGAMEKTLYAHRDLAIELDELYAEVKGARKWEKRNR